jgi:integrase/recombinase XerD
MNTAGVASLLQRFFTDRLREQQGVSPHTVASYRDTFRLLLRYAAQQLKRGPCELRMEELDASFLEKFLRHLERDRANSARTRNARLSALHAFFRFVAINEPALSLQCQRILAIPEKRYPRGPVEFLTEEEAAALVAAPDPGTWIGARDRALLLVAIQTGLRNVSFRQDGMKSLNVLGKVGCEFNPMRSSRWTTWRRWRQQGTARALNR